MICSSFLRLFIVGVPSMSGDVVERSESFSCFTKWLRFCQHKKKKNLKYSFLFSCFIFFCCRRPNVPRRPPDLCEVIDQSQVSLLQLRPRQCRQRVGIVQLFTEVWREQIWVKSNHMSGIWTEPEEEEMKTFGLMSDHWGTVRPVNTLTPFTTDRETCAPSPH